MFDSLDPADDSCDREKEEKIDEGFWRSQEDTDPSGMREAWIKTRAAVRRYAEKRKASMKYRQTSGCNRTNPSDSGIERIQSKVQQTKKDLGCMLKEGDSEPEVTVNGASPMTDPPNKGGGLDPNLADPWKPLKEVYRKIPNPIEEMSFSGLDPGVLKEQIEEELKPHKSPRSITCTHPATMAEKSPPQEQGTGVSDREGGCARQGRARLPW